MNLLYCFKHARMCGYSYALRSFSNYMDAEGPEKCRILYDINERIYHRGKHEKDLKYLFAKHTNGQRLKLADPVTLSEKIQWLKLYDATKLKTELTDKYLAREWINRKLQEDYAVPLLGVWDAFDQIDFRRLPDSFALKTNHGSGWNMLIKSKNEMNLPDLKYKFENWMMLNYAFKSYELQYYHIQPLIIAEELLPPFLYGSNEYKFLCINGNIEYIYNFGKNDKSEKIYWTTTLYDECWNRLNWLDGEYIVSRAPEPRPEKLDEMIWIAKTLSRDFPLVRVDLYEANGKIYVGELTFTPSSGFFQFTSEEENIRLGKKLILPGLTEFSI